MTLPSTDSTPERSSPDATTAKRPDWWLFLSKFLKGGTKIASFAPSSRFMARAIIDGIDYDNAKCIVELGAGTGPVTAELLKRVKPHTKLIIVERDKDFCDRLRLRFPQADIVQADAAKLEEMLDSRGVDKACHIVSGLPLPSFPVPLRNAVLASCAKRLSPEGTFRQLTVMPYVYWRMYRGYFASVRFKLVPLNLPPSGVYVCRGFKTKA